MSSLQLWERISLSGKICKLPIRPVHVLNYFISLYRLWMIEVTRKRPLDRYRSLPLLTARTLTCYFLVQLHALVLYKNNLLILRTGGYSLISQLIFPECVETHRPQPEKHICYLVKTGTKISMKPHPDPWIRIQSELLAYTYTQVYYTFESIVVNYLNGYIMVSVQFVELTVLIHSNTLTHLMWPLIYTLQ